MSRPRKIHPPLKGGVNSILAAVAMGSGKGKQAAQALERAKQTRVAQPTPAKKP